MHINNLNIAMTGVASAAFAMRREFWADDEIGNIDAPDWFPSGSHAGHIGRYSQSDTYFIEGELDRDRYRWI